MRLVRSNTPHASKKHVFFIPSNTMKCNGGLIISGPSVSWKQANLTVTEKVPDNLPVTEKVRSIVTVILKQ